MFTFSTRSGQGPVAGTAFHTKYHRCFPSVEFHRMVCPDPVPMPAGYVRSNVTGFLECVQCSEKSMTNRCKLPKFLSNSINQPSQYHIFPPFLAKSLIRPSLSRKTRVFFSHLGKTSNHHESTCATHAPHMRWWTEAPGYWGSVSQQLRCSVVLDWSVSPLSTSSARYFFCNLYRKSS